MGVAKLVTVNFSVGIVMPTYVIHATHSTHVTHALAVQDDMQGTPIFSVLSCLWHPSPEFLPLANARVEILPSPSGRGGHRDPSKSKEDIKPHVPLTPLTLKSS